MGLDIDRVREMFPVTELCAYFVTNGLAPLPRPTAEALHQAIDEFRDQGVIAIYGKEQQIVAECRERFARLLGCDPSEIGFTRNTGEGLLWAASSIRWNEGDEVVVADGEYPTVVYPWMAQEENGVRLRKVPMDNHRITPELIAGALTERTRVVALSFVQWTTGFRANLREIGRLCRENGTLLVVDAIQGLGAIELDVRRDNVDILAAGCHKWLLGLQGLGVFFCRRDLLEELRTTHVALGSMKRREGEGDFAEQGYPFDLKDDVSRFEEGTHNLVGIKAQIATLKLLEEIGIGNIQSRIKELTDYLLKGAEAKGCEIVSPRGEGEWSGIVLFQPANRPADEINQELHAQLVASNAMQGCLHLGVNFYNTEEEIDKVLAMLE